MIGSYVFPGSKPALGGIPSVASATNTGSGVVRPRPSSLVPPAPQSATGWKSTNPTVVAVRAIATQAGAIGTTTPIYSKTVAPVGGTGGAFAGPNGVAGAPVGTPGLFGFTTGQVVIAGIVAIAAVYVLRS